MKRARLRDMITAFRVSDLVATAAQFRLADYLADGPRSSAELGQLCDAYVLKFILHDWEDEKCAQILKSCRAAATRDTRLLLVEAVLPEDGGPLTDAVSGDITMIVHTGGRECPERSMQRCWSRRDYD